MWIPLGLLVRPIRDVACMWFRKDQSNDPRTFIYRFEESYPADTRHVVKYRDGDSPKSKDRKTKKERGKDRGSGKGSRAHKARGKVDKTSPLDEALIGDEATVHAAASAPATRAGDGGRWVHIPG
jgi:hypothetical protein